MNNQSPAMHTPEVKIGTGLLALNLSTLCKNLVAAHRITQLEASCIENAVDAYAANQRTIEELREALMRADDLARDLMERANRMDARLCAADGRKPDCELGEVSRMHAFLNGQARAALANSQTKEGQP